MPVVANTLVNLSIFYQENQKDKEKSIVLVTEAIFILLPMLEKIPFTQKYFQSAIAVLKNWEIDPEQYITALLNEMQKGNEE